MENKYNVKMERLASIRLIRDFKLIRIVFSKMFNALYCSGLGKKKR